MGQGGDLLLVFADSLVRSWKQITKFKPAGVPAARGAGVSEGASEGESAMGAAQDCLGRSPGAPTLGSARAGEGPTPAFSLEGLVRDERGIRLAPEVED
jgi:cyanophycin synthetase